MLSEIVPSVTINVAFVNTIQKPAVIFFSPLAIAAWIDLLRMILCAWSQRRLVKGHHAEFPIGPHIDILPASLHPVKLDDQSLLAIGAMLKIPLVRDETT